MDKEQEKMCCELSLRWHGWGSPVGLGIFLVCAAICAHILRSVIMG